MIGALLLAAAVQPYADCAKPDASGALPTLEQVLDCQRKARQEFIAGYEKRHGRAPSGPQLDDLDERQRREAREHALRHPGLATITPREEAPAQAPAQAAEAPEQAPERGGVLSELKGRFAAAWDELKGVLNSGAAPKAQPKGAAAELFQGGTDALKTVVDKADRKADVDQAVQGYSRQLDENLDPAMKRYYQKDAPRPSSK